MRLAAAVELAANRLSDPLSRLLRYEFVVVLQRLQGNIEPTAWATVLHKGEPRRGVVRRHAEGRENDTGRRGQFRVEHRLARFGNTEQPCPAFCLRQNSHRIAKM